MFINQKNANEKAQFILIIENFQSAKSKLMLQQTSFIREEANYKNNFKLTIYNFYKQTIFMISQKRFFARHPRISKPQTNRYKEQNENMGIFEPFQSNILNPRARKRCARPQLAEISNSTNEITNNQLFGGKNSRAKAVGCKVQRFGSLEKNNEDNAQKFLECSLNENIILASSHIEGKNQSKYSFDRPKTSLSQQSQNKNELFVKTCKVIFQSKQLPIEDERISTSRALSKYSMVQKNTPRNRFKVKKDRNLAPTYLSARKIALQVKEKRQKSSTEFLRDSTNLARKLSKNKRYAAVDQFQIKGWDYD